MDIEAIHVIIKFNYRIAFSPLFNRNLPYGGSRRSYLVHEGSIRDGCVVRGYSSLEFGTAIISADMVHARAIESIQQVYMCPTPTSNTSQWSLSTFKGNTGKCGPLVLVLHHLSGWSPRMAWESSKGQNYRADSAAEA